MKNATKMLVALTVLGCAVGFGQIREARTTSRGVIAQSEPSEPSRAVTYVAPAVPLATSKTVRATPSAPAPAQPTEFELMRAMRELTASDPEQALSLARAAEVRFGETVDSAERDWVVVKSLTGLQRFHDAQDEARMLVARFPDSPWAADVERHILVYPLDQPSREEQQAFQSEPPGSP